MRLEDYKNRQPFSTPDGYFEELSSKIIGATSKAPATAATPVKKSIRLGMYAKWLSVAAMLVFVCLITFNGTGNKQTAGSTILAAGTEQTPADGTENIAEEEFMDNLLDNYPIDDYTFYCYLTEYE